MKYFIFAIALVLAACEGAYEEDIDTDADTITDSIATATESTTAITDIDTGFCDHMQPFPDYCMINAPDGYEYLLLFQTWSYTNGECVGTWYFYRCENACKYDEEWRGFCI